jgi:ABC-type Fe3+-hydroxamate transport system substrate-binding protein
LPASAGFARALLGFVLWGCEPQAAPDPANRTTEAASNTFEAVDDAGRTLRLDRPAQRIISLLPAGSETIVALGAGDRLVARTDHDTEPQYSHLPSVGGGLTPSVEVMASLEPDLVIAWEEAGTARIRPRLEALGVEVFAVRTQDTAAIYANVARLGRLLGRDRAADSLAAAMRAELDAVRATVRGKPPLSVLYMISLDPPIVAGPNVFIGQLLEVAGGRNVFPEVSAPSPQVTLEEVVRRRPELIIVPSAEDRAAVVARLRGLAGWRELLAAEGTRVETIPIDLLHRPGPGITGATWALRDVIHRDGRVHE